MNTMPDTVDKLPLATVGWMTQQIIDHESNPEKWWPNPAGFSLVDVEADYDPAFDAEVEPPAGWENLPVYMPPEAGEGDG